MIHHRRPHLNRQLDDVLEDLLGLPLVQLLAGLRGPLHQPVEVVEERGSRVVDEQRAPGARGRESTQQLLLGAQPKVAGSAARCWAAASTGPGWVRSTTCSRRLHHYKDVGS